MIMIWWCSTNVGCCKMNSPKASSHSTRSFQVAEQVNLQLPQINSQLRFCLPLQLVANYPFNSKFNYFKAMPQRPPDDCLSDCENFLLCSFPSPHPFLDITFTFASSVAMGEGGGRREIVQEETINLSRGKFHGSLPEVSWILSTHLSCLLTYFFKLRRYPCHLFRLPEYVDCVGTNTKRCQLLPTTSEENLLSKVNLPFATHWMLGR